MIPLIVLVPLVAMVTFVAMFPSVIMVYVSIGTTPITVFDVAIGTNLVPFKHWYHEINGPIKTDDAILSKSILKFGNYLQILYLYIPMVLGTEVRGCQLLVPYIETNGINYKWNSSTSISSDKS